MSSFFQQTAQERIAKHINRFPLLKLDQVLDWQTIQQHLTTKKLAMLATMAAVPPTLLLSVLLQSLRP